MDRQQFIQHVESNQKAVRRFLTALCCGDAALADDLAQDTFVKAYLSCDTFRGDSKFSVWIYRIAYNTFVSSRRSARQSEPISEAERMSGADRADSAFEYQALYAAMEQLSEKERTAILLYYMQGYAINEIAEITGASVEAVKQQLSRGRRNLKGLLTE
ncbi:MAG: RNA polymerase sigma factor [Paramuribaculum sp.]|nr:RNA polymerase sigma factor [Paramuribaculum sp.]MDE6783515.1 RNA polymerase sigma factor [Paramuribaculum sp.]